MRSKCINTAKCLAGVGLSGSAASQKSSSAAPSVKGILSAHLKKAHGPQEREREYN